MLASNCKIGYEIAWQGKRLICVGVYRDVVRFQFRGTTIFLDKKNEVYLPCFKVGIKCVEYHEGVETSEQLMQFHGKVYVNWEYLK